MIIPTPAAQSGAARPTRADVALAVHRTLQKTLAQPKDTKLPVPLLAQCALDVLQKRADTVQALRAQPSPIGRPAHCPPLPKVRLCLPHRPKGAVAVRLEHAVPAYMATLTQSTPPLACSLISFFVLPAETTLRERTASSPKQRLALIDLQNMLLQATWQPDGLTYWFAALNRCTDWLGVTRRPLPAGLSARRVLSAALAQNLRQLWRSLLAAAATDPAATATEPSAVVQALSTWPLMSELCDYDILRRSVIQRAGAAIDVRLLQAVLMQAVAADALSSRASLQLRLLAYRLTAFEPAAHAAAACGASPHSLRFARLGPALQAASQVIEQSDAERVDPAPLAVSAESSDAQALRGAHALVEIYAATCAFRRGVSDVAEC